MGNPVVKYLADPGSMVRMALGLVLGLVIGTGVDTESLGLSGLVTGVLIASLVLGVAVEYIRAKLDEKLGMERDNPLAGPFEKLDGLLVGLSIYGTTAVIVVLRWLF